MTTFTGKSKNRIVVWQTESIARSADTEETDLCKRMTVWRTYEEAAENVSFDDSGVPEWVPENAKIHIDFVNDRAWTEADGEVAIATLLGTDEGEDYWGGEPAFVPEDDLTVNGLAHVAGGSQHSYAFLGAAKSALLSGAGFTYTFATKVVTEGIDNGYPLLFVAEDAAVDIRGGVLGILLENDFSALSITTTNGAGIGAANEVNKIALTIRPPPNGSADMCMNGGSVTSGVIETGDWPSDILVVEMQPTTSNPRLAVQAITIYDPLPDTDGLSELSDV